jgi:hypothetical protein
MAGRTATYYKNNPESYEKKKEYQKKYNKEKAKLKVKSCRTGKMIQPDSDSRNKNRKADREGKNTNGKQYDHHEGKFIDAKENMSKKNPKSFKFRIKGKKKKK